MRIVLFCLVVLSLGYSAKNDSLEIVRLRGKVDSLSQALNVQVNQLKYEKDSDKQLIMTSMDKVDSHIDWIFQGACTLVAGVFGFMAIMGLIQYRISESQAKHIQKAVSDTADKRFKQIESRTNMHLGEGRKELFEIQLLAREALTKAKEEVGERILNISKNHREVVDKQLGVVRFMAIGEALSVMKQSPQAARSFAFAGMQIMDNPYEGYEEQVKIIARNIVAAYSRNPNLNPKHEASDGPVRAFANRLGEIDENLQKMIHHELDKFRG